MMNNDLIERELIRQEMLMEARADAIHENDMYDYDYAFNYMDLTTDSTINDGINAVKMLNRYDHGVTICDVISEIT